MANKRILWIFPLLTQLIFSPFLLVLGEFTLNGAGLVFVCATFPAFLFALICVRYQFHQRNLIQIAFWSGVISFFTMFVLFSILLTFDEYLEPGISTWENTLAASFYALMFALMSIFYAMIVLRLFLPKMRD